MRCDRHRCSWLWMWRLALRVVSPVQEMMKPGAQPYIFASRWAGARLSSWTWILIPLGPETGAFPYLLVRSSTKVLDRSINLRLTHLFLVPHFHHDVIKRGTTRLTFWMNPSQRIFSSNVSTMMSIRRAASPPVRVESGGAS